MYIAQLINGIFSLQCQICAQIVMHGLLPNCLTKNRNYIRLNIVKTSKDDNFQSGLFIALFHTVNLSGSRKLVAANQFISSKLRNKVIANTS